MRCADCGHHPDDYTPGDLASTLDLAATLWDLVLAPVPPALLQRAVPAPLELRDRSVAAVAAAGSDDERRRDTLHRLCHDLAAASRALHAAGATPAAGQGTVAALHVSGGGVPKLPVPRAEVTSHGIAGDVQHNRRHHGRPFQAVSLWSNDVIRALRSEGHPVRPGSAGENLSVEGLDWAALRPGVRLGVGPEVVLELSSYAVPCAKIRDSFADRDFSRVHHELHPGWSRMYAWVRRPGEVREGDPVVVEP